MGEAAPKFIPHEEVPDNKGADVLEFKKPAEEIDVEDSPQIKMIRAEKIFGDASLAFERIQDASDALNEAKTEETKNAAGEELRDAKRVMPGINREMFSLLVHKFRGELGDDYKNSPQREVLKMMLDKAIEEGVKKIEREKEDTARLFEQASIIYERIQDAEQAIGEAKSDETRKFAQEELDLAEEEMPVIDGPTFFFLEDKLKKDLGDDFEGSGEKEVLYRMAKISVRPERLSGESEEKEPKFKVLEPEEVMGREIEFCKHGKESQYCSECRAIKDALKSVGVEPFKG